MRIIELHLFFSCHSQVKDLAKALPVIGTINQMLNSTGYIAGWQVVIASPFGKLDPQPTSKQVADCIGSLRLLHSCPVIDKLEFTDIIGRCFHCAQAHLAAALLPFLNDSDKAYVLRVIALFAFDFLFLRFVNSETIFYLQEIKENCRVTEVMNDVTALSHKGILVVSQV